MYNPVMSFNVEFAVRVAQRLRKYGLRWLEEPLVPRRPRRTHRAAKSNKLGPPRNRRRPSRAPRLPPAHRAPRHRHRPARPQVVRRLNRGNQDIHHRRGSRHRHHPPRRRRHPLRPALRPRNARIPNGRILDGLRPRRPLGGSLPHPRHAHAQRRLRHPLRRPRLRHGNQPRVDNPLGPHRRNEDTGVKQLQ